MADSKEKIKKEIKTKDGIRERDDGRFDARPYIKLADGSSKRICIIDKDRREVKKKLYKALNDSSEGKYIANDKIDLRTYAERWLKTHSMSIEETTAEAYKLCMDKHIIPTLGEKKIQQIKPADIQKVYNETLITEYKPGKKYTANTVKHIHVLLNMILKDAYKNTIIPRNPADFVDVPKKEKYKPKVYNEIQFEDLMKKLDDPLLECAAMLTGYLGLRISEALGLRWSDINLDEKCLTINQVLFRVKGKVGFKKTKTEAGNRKLYFDDFAKDMLVKRKKQCSKNVYHIDFLKLDLVICRDNGKQIRNDNFWEMFTDALDYNKIDKTTLHALRHYNATMMKKYGVDLKTASERLGHAQISTTADLYTHAEDDSNREAANKLGGMFSKKGSKKGSKQKTQKNRGQC